MKKWVIASLAMSGSAVIGACAGAGTYAAVASYNKDSGTSTNAAVGGPAVSELMQDIFKKIEKLPGNDHPTYKSFEEFETAIKEDLKKDTSNGHKNLKTEVIDILNGELEKVMKNVSDELDNASNHNEVQFIKTQLEEYSQDVTDFTEDIKLGVVGEHDLNYFQDVLDDKIDDSIFATSKEELDKKVNDVKALVETIKTNIGVDIKNLTDDFKTKYTDFSSQINTHVSDLLQEIGDNKTAISGLSSNVTGAQDMIDSLDANLTKLTALITTRKAEFDKHIKEFNDFKASQIAGVDALTDSFFKMTSDLEYILDKINDNNDNTNDVLEELKSMDSKLSTKIDGIILKNHKIEIDLENVEDQIKDLEDVQSEMYAKFNQNESDIEDLKSNLAGLSDESNKIADRISATENSLQNVLSIVNSIDLVSVEKKISDNQALILEYGASLKLATDNIANILNDLNQIVAKANDNEARIYKLEQLIESMNNGGDNSSNVISEYESLYNTGPQILNNKIYLKNAINKYAKIDIVIMPEHDKWLSQVISFAPEKNKTTGAITYRGNGLVQGWMMSLHTVFDYNENSVMVKEIEIHNWGSWKKAKLQSIRGWLY